MSRLIQIQTNFSVGEVDPLIRGRIDLAQYYSALKKATNVTVIPQGGVRRRPGLRYVSELPANASDGAILIPFEFSVTDSYMFALTHQRIYVFKNGSLITNINGTGNPYIAASTITSAMLSTINWAQSADTLILVHEDLPPQKLVRGATDASWTFGALTIDHYPNHAFTITLTSPTTTLTPSAKDGTIELTAAGGTFSAADVEQYIQVKEGYGYGRARIIGYISTTKVTAQTIIPFNKTTAYASGEWEIEGGYEHVWSATRGYPRSVTFHQGRLFFGGSKSRPATVWGSRVGDYFNFDPGTVLDDDAVEATVDTAQLNSIVHTYSGRDLQFFTTGAEFYVPQNLMDPITPSNFFVKVATLNGCKKEIRPQGLESGTLFIQRQGKAVNEFVYTDTQAAYVSNKISLLSSHLLKNPTDIAIRRATSTDESDQLLIINSDDGTMICFSMLRSQQVIAPSEFITDGMFKSVGVDVDTIYAIVQRTINGSTKYFVERFDSTLTLDNAVSGGAAASVTAANLAAKTCKVIADGVVLADSVANSSGVVTFSRSSVTSYQVGLNYDVEIQTMPVEPRLQSGNLRGFKKRIIEVNAEFYKTQSASIAGQEVQFRKFDSAVFDTPVAEYTGIKTVGPLLGFDYEGVITITQPIPLKMTLLFLDYKVSVGQ